MAENLREGVSVIIPARNEEANIARAVRSVAAQSGIREIIVADDGSADRTGEILQSLCGEIPALRRMPIDAPPAGWTGKSHAAAGAAQEAAGEWLLFTDADTEHRAGSLAALLALAQGHQADLLSVSPGQRVQTWWEKSVIPFVYVHLARLYRFEEVSDPASPAAAANGQYLLIRREAYERAGGHRAVRGAILEDVELARRVKSTGGRILFLPGAEWVETRMYRTFGEMWLGWTKNLFLLYASAGGGMLGALLEAVILDVALPLIFLALCVTMLLGLGEFKILTLGVVCSLLGVLVNLRTYGKAIGRLGFDRTLANYQFPGAALFSLLLINSVIAHRWRRRVHWKGREYPTGARGEDGK